MANLRKTFDYPLKRKNYQKRAVNAFENFFVSMTRSMTKEGYFVDRERSQTRFKTNAVPTRNIRFPLITVVIISDKTISRMHFGVLAFFLSLDVWEG